MANIFDRFFNKKTEPVTFTTQTVKPMGDNIKSFEMNTNYGISVLNQYNLIKTNKGYLQGIDGFYPEELNMLFHQSPLHGSILNFKRLLTTGNGYTSDDVLNISQKISLNQLTNQFDSFVNEIALDLHTHAKICLKVTWNQDNTKIIKLERLGPETIHVNDLDEYMEPINFLYSWDWCNYTRFPIIKYAKFDQMNKKDKVQLFFYQTTSPGQKLYAVPSYHSALNWIKIDAEYSEYHKANINNSVNPSMLIQFYQVPETQEEKQKVVLDTNTSFAGARKTGRTLMTWSDGKDLAPSVTQLQPTQLDKTFLQLGDSIGRNICYSHQVDPQLLGLKTPGSLGESGTFEYAFNMFNQTVIQPAQQAIESILNDFISINGIPAKVKFNKVDITKLNPSAAPVQATTEAMVKEDNKEAIPVNETLTNLSGKQNIHLDRILRKYDNGKISKERAKVLLKSSFGFTDEEIETLLGEIE